MQKARYYWSGWVHLKMGDDYLLNGSIIADDDNVKGVRKEIKRILKKEKSCIFTDYQIVSIVAIKE